MDRQPLRLVREGAGVEVADREAVRAAADRRVEDDRRGGEGLDMGLDLDRGHAAEQERPLDVGVRLDGVAGFAQRLELVDGEDDARGELGRVAGGHDAADEAGAQEVDQLGEADAQRGELAADAGGFGHPGGIAGGEAVERRDRDRWRDRRPGRGQGGQDLIVAPEQAEPLRRDRRVALRLGGVREEADQFRARGAGLAKMDAGGGDEAVEGEGDWIDCLADRLVGLGRNMLGRGGQLGAGDAGRGFVWQRRDAVAGGHDALQDLVDEIDGRERRVGVLAGELDVGEVRPAADDARRAARLQRLGRMADQDVERRDEGRRIGRAALVEKLEEVDQIGSRSDHRAAVVALAHLGAAEEVGPGGDRRVDGVVGRGCIRLAGIARERPARSGGHDIALVLMLGDNEVRHSVGERAGSLVHRGERVHLLFGGAGEVGEERRFPVAGDVDCAAQQRRAVQPLEDELLQDCRVGADGEEPLDALGVLNGGRPQVEVVHAFEQPLASGLDEAVEIAASEVEVGLGHRRGEQVRGDGRDRGGIPIAPVAGEPGDDGCRVAGLKEAADLARIALGGVGRGLLGPAHERRAARRRDELLDLGAVEAEREPAQRGRLRNGGPQGLGQRGIVGGQRAELQRELQRVGINIRIARFVVGPERLAGTGMIGGRGEKLLALADLREDPSDHGAERPRLPGRRGIQRHSHGQLADAGRGFVRTAFDLRDDESVDGLIEAEGEVVDAPGSDRPRVAGAKLTRDAVKRGRRTAGEIASSDAMRPRQVLDERDRLADLAGGEGHVARPGLVELGQRTPIGERPQRFEEALELRRPAGRPHATRDDAHQLVRPGNDAEELLLVGRHELRLDRIGIAVRETHDIETLDRRAVAAELENEVGGRIGRVSAGEGFGLVADVELAARPGDHAAELIAEAADVAVENVDPDARHGAASLVHHRATDTQSAALRHRVPLDLQVDAEIAARLLPVGTSELGVGVQHRDDRFDRLLAGEDVVPWAGVPGGVIVGAILAIAIGRGLGAEGAAEIVDVGHPDGEACGRVAVLISDPAGDAAEAFRIEQAGIDAFRRVRVHLAPPRRLDVELGLQARDRLGRRPAVSRVLELVVWDIADAERAEHGVQAADSRADRADGQRGEREERNRHDTSSSGPAAAGPCGSPVLRQHEEAGVAIRLHPLADSRPFALGRNVRDPTRFQAAALELHAADIDRVDALDVNDVIALRHADIHGGGARVAAAGTLEVGLLQHVAVLVERAADGLVFVWLGLHLRGCRCVLRADLGLA